MQATSEREAVEIIAGPHSGLCGHVADRTERAVLVETQLGDWVWVDASEVRPARHK